MLLDTRYENHATKLLRNKMQVYAKVGANTVLQTQEEYSYDTLDQLTQYKFRNSTGGSWTTANYAYDSAGNRTTGGAVYDNLNRMTTAPGGGTRTYDLLGNTTERNGEEYVWDNFGRLHGIGGSESSRSYRYRPDGLRILRVIDSRTAELLDDYSAWESVPESWRDPTYRYFYDGQMVHEDDYLRYVTVGGRERRLHTVNRYGLGARGMDWFEREEWHDGGIQSRSTVFPVYDGHGNNLASLTRNGSGGYALSNLRFYDAWGAPRGGGHDADTRYCANLGHRTDDESSLVYMRARYYEPGTGRFISEDPAMDGWNWYAYCNNDPVGYIDVTGKNALVGIFNIICMGAGIAFGMGLGFWLVKTALKLDTTMRSEVKNEILGHFKSGPSQYLAEMFEGVFGALFLNAMPTMGGILSGNVMLTVIGVLRGAGAAFGFGAIVGCLANLYSAILAFWACSLAYESEGLSAVQQ